MELLTAGKQGAKPWSQYTVLWWGTMPTRIRWASGDVGGNIYGSFRVTLSGGMGLYWYNMQFCDGRGSLQKFMRICRRRDTLWVAKCVMLLLVSGSFKHSHPTSGDYLATTFLSLQEIESPQMPMERIRWLPFQLCQGGTRAMLTYVVIFRRLSAPTRRSCPTSVLEGSRAMVLVRSTNNSKLLTILGFWCSWSVVWTKHVLLMGFVKKYNVVLMSRVEFRQNVEF